MDTKYPKHLIQHGNKWQVKLQIPVDVRWAFDGRTNFKRSTGCSLGQMEQAIAKRDVIVASFKAQVNAHRTGDMQPVVNLADQYRKDYQELEMAYKGKDGKKTAKEKDQLEVEQRVVIEEATKKIMTTLIGENWENILEEEAERIEREHPYAPYGSEINKDLLWEKFDPGDVHKRFMHEVKGEAFKSHVEEWKKARIQDKLNRSLKDVNTDVGYVNDFSKEFVLINDINHQDVIAYTSKLRDPPHNKSVSNVKRRITACKQYWEYLDRERGLVPRSIKPPFERLGLPDKRNGKKYDRISWSSEDLETILRKKTNHTNRMLDHIIRIGIMTGMRIEEICSMEVDDIQIKDNIRVIYIPKSKTIAGTRYVPIHSQLEWIIDELIRDTKDTYLIPSAANKYDRRSDKWSKRFGRHKTALGFPKNTLVFHSIRKYANSILASQQINKQRRQMLFGWDRGDGEDMADATYSDDLIAYPIGDRKRDIELVTSELPFIQYGPARYTK